jgi:hypothetical protein
MMMANATRGPLLVPGGSSPFIQAGYQTSSALAVALHPGATISMPSETIEIWIFLYFNQDLKRTRQHNERGPESLMAMLRLLPGHDLSHLDQITRYIEAVRQQE